MFPPPEPPHVEPLPETLPDLAAADLQPGATEAPPPVGATPPTHLVAAAAEGRRGAAWRLLHWISEDNREAIQAIRRFPDERLLSHLLEWLALGTWAGRPFKIPYAMRQPHFRTQARTLFLPGPAAPEGLALRVLRAGVQDRRAAIREESAHLLGILSDPATLPDLLNALSDPAPEVRTQAAKALGRLRAPDVAPPLVAALNTHDEALASQARLALLQLGAPALPPLLEAARSPDAWVRWHALRVLGELHDQRCQSALIAALADSDHAVAWMAARELANMGVQVVIPILHLLQTTSATPWLMETAAYVLRAQQHTALWPILAPLIRAMHSSDYRVETPLAVERALQQING